VRQQRSGPYRCPVSDHELVGRRHAERRCRFGVLERSAES
jgi:hypothetical protein